MNWLSFFGLLLRLHFISSLLKCFKVANQDIELELPARDRKLNLVEDTSTLACYLNLLELLDDALNSLMMVLRSEFDQVSQDGLDVISTFFVFEINKVLHEPTQVLRNSNQEVVWWADQLRVIHPNYSLHQLFM